MMSPISISNEDRILIVAPHPDDECIGCGGVLAKYGNQCDVVVLTDGSMSNACVLPDEMRKTRRVEFEQEMKTAGVKSYYMLNIFDGELINCPECMKSIDMSAYSVVFLPWGDDNHPDHTAAFLYARASLQRQSVNARVYQYEVHVPFKDPDCMLDISNVIKKKEALIGFHKSQLVNVCYVDKAVALAKYRACEAGVPDGYVEAYVSTDINVEDREIDKIFARERKLAKNVEFVKLLSKWVEKSQSGWSVAEELSQRGYDNASIYGFSDLGRLVYLDCVNHGFNIVDILDNRSLNDPDDKHKVFKPKDGNRGVSVVLVTAVAEFDSIFETLCNMKYGKVISLKDIIFEKVDD